MCIGATSGGNGVTPAAAAFTFGVSINDVHKIFGFFNPLPLAHIWN